VTPAFAEAGKFWDDIVDEEAIGVPPTSEQRQSWKAPMS
jgi:hypothetical protein